MVRLTPEERFWPKIEFGRINPLPLGRCWEWRHARAEFGYGLFWDGRRMARAHREAWTFTFGPIPPDVLVLHHCDNPPCIRPDHLFLGTDADNVADMHRKGRGNVGERNGKAILAADDVRHVRAWLAAGFTQQSVAAAYGVGHGTVHMIRAGKNWRTVE